MILKHGQRHQWLWTSPGGVSGSQGSQHSSCSSGSWQPSSLQLKMVACCWVTLRACVSNSPGWRERGAEIFKTSLRISQGDSDETGPGFFLYVCQPLMGPNVNHTQSWNVICPGLEGQRATLGTCFCFCVCTICICFGCWAEQDIKLNEIDWVSTEGTWQGQDW